MCLHHQLATLQHHLGMQRMGRAHQPKATEINALKPNKDNPRSLVGPFHSLEPQDVCFLPYISILH